MWIKDIAKTIRIKIGIVLENYLISEHIRQWATSYALWKLAQVSIVKKLWM
ncbi:MAG: hypothetical protein RR627_11080 [Niameybacter sp.]